MTEVNQNTLQASGYTATQNYLGVQGLDEHPTYSLNIRHWQPIIDMLGGQPRLHQLAARYLPQQQGERDEDHLIRTERSVLENYYGHGIHTLSTSPFAQPVTLMADAALPMKWQENVDGAGSTLTEFAERTLREVLIFGLAHVGVFLPAFDGIPSLWDMEEEWLYPYFRLLPTLNVYDWLVNRREQVEEIREVQYTYDREHELKVSVIYYDGYGFKELRVKRGQGDNKDMLEDDPNDVPSKPYSANPELKLAGPPIVQCYASQPQSPMTARPPFADCAAVNLEHFTQTNQKYHYLSTAMTRWQVLKQVNLKEIERAERSKKQAAAAEKGNILSATTDELTTQRILIGADGDVFYVAPDTSAAVPVTETIKMLAEYLEQRFGGNASTPTPQMTATQTLLGTVAARSAVRSAVFNVEDALTKACRLAYRLLGRTPPDSLKVTIDRSYEETFLTNPSPPPMEGDPPEPEPAKDPDNG